MGKSVVAALVGVVVVVIACAEPPQTAAAETCTSETECADLAARQTYLKNQCSMNCDGYDEARRIGETRAMQFRQERLDREAEVERRRRARLEQTQQEQRDREADLKQDAASVRRWHELVVDRCVNEQSSNACADEETTDGVKLHDDDRATCRSDCSDALRFAMDQDRSAALAACKSGATKGCEFHVRPEGVNLDAIEESCSRECAFALRAAAPLQRSTPRAPTTVAAPPRGAVCGGSAQCCDGTCSPTCACPGHRGCCSHHGGLCGC